jgi:hypothetical protein
VHTILESESEGLKLSPTSYSDVFAIEHDRDVEEEIQAGDMVRTGPNLYPHYTVIAVSGDKVWVRNVQTGVDGLTPVSRCRKINGAPPLDAL